MINAIVSLITNFIVDLGDLGVLASRSRLVGSNSNVFGALFQDLKVVRTSPPGGTLSCGF